MHIVKQFIARWMLARATHRQQARARAELRAMDLPGLRDLALAPAEVEFWLTRSAAGKTPICRP